MGLLIFYLCLAIGISFLCSILEAVLLSITPSYIQSLQGKDANRGAQLRALKENIDRPLAAILSFNTIAHTVGAAGVGAQAAVVFSDVSIGIISGVLTLLILIFSEIIPKTLGAKYWRSLTGFAVKTLRILIILMYPLVWLSKLITLLFAKKSDGPSISRAEVSAMADIGHQEGIFKESELRVLKNLIQLKSVRAKDVMTPRTVVVMASEDLTLQELYERKDIKQFSRILMYSGRVDHVTGYIHKVDLLGKLADDQHDLPLTEIKRDIVVVKEEERIPDIFENLMEKREQIALVVDSFGGTSGIVTMEDILETLLGLEIMDEFDSDEDLQQYARGRWRKRARKLGLISEEEEKAKAVQFGITGGKEPDESR